MVHLLRAANELDIGDAVLADFMFITSSVIELINVLKCQKA